MTEHKKLYLSERALSALPWNKSKERTMPYHSDTHLKEWISKESIDQDNKQGTATITVINVDDLLKYLNEK